MIKKKNQCQPIPMQTGNANIICRPHSHMLFLQALFHAFPFFKEFMILTQVTLSYTWALIPTRCVSLSNLPKLSKSLFLPADQ